MTFEEVKDSRDILPDVWKFPYVASLSLVRLAAFTEDVELVVPHEVVANVL